jgi:hypothetical protein
LLRFFIFWRYLFLLFCVWLFQHGELMTHPLRRIDEACYHLFRLMNYIWDRQNLSYEGVRVHTHCYQVVAMTSEMGCLEYISECISLSQLTKERVRVRTG